MEPPSRLGYGIVHAPLEFLLKLPQFGPHALADRFASHGEVPQTILPFTLKIPKKGEQKAHTCAIA
jgi:hypothetical protein